MLAINTSDTDQTPPTLYLTIQRSVDSGLVSSNKLEAETLAAVATITFKNAVFQPTRGLDVQSTSDVSISFPDPHTLQIAVKPQSKQIVQGNLFAVFAAEVIRVQKLGVLLSDPAVALVGEMTHTKNLGQLLVNVVDSSDNSLLPAKDASRPFALVTPAEVKKSSEATA